MNYKVEGALRKNKKYFILFGILWLFIAIVLIVPITVGYNTAVQQDGSAGIAAFVNTMKNPFAGIAEISAGNGQSMPPFRTMRWLRVPESPLWGTAET